MIKKVIVLDNARSNAGYRKQLIRVHIQLFSFRQIQLAGTDRQRPEIRTCPGMPLKKPSRYVRSFFVQEVVEGDNAILADSICRDGEIVDDDISPVTSIDTEEPHPPDRIQYLIRFDLQRRALDDDNTRLRN